MLPSLRQVILHGVTSKRQVSNERFNANIKQTPILFDHNDDQYANLIKRQENTDKNKDTEFLCFCH